MSPLTITFLPCNFLAMNTLRGFIAIAPTPQFDLAPARLCVSVGLARVSDSRAILCYWVYSGGGENPSFHSFFYCCTGWWWAAQCTLVNQLSFSGSPTQWALNSVLHFSQFTRLYTGVDALHVGWWWALYIANHCMGDIHPCTEGDTLPTDDKFCRNEY